MLPEAPRDSIYYEDDYVYACLALYPLTKGHTVIVLKKALPDLKDLSDSEYDYLMAVVDVARDALLEILKVEKVYLMYMDEAKQVHWHLVPRYDEQGVNVLAHEPQKSDDFSLVPALHDAFIKRYSTRVLHLPK